MCTVWYSTNPYLVCATRRSPEKFPWPELEAHNNDMRDKILGLAGLRVVYEYRTEHPLPVELRPPGMPEDRHPYPETHEKLVIERSRHEILRHGPLDTLTVTYSELVDRDWWGFADYKENGYPLDQDAVCTAMDFKQTWSDVSKIRLHSSREIELLMQGKDGEESVSISPNLLRGHGRAMENFARRLTDELHLRRAVVDGVYEFGVV
jgi:hypothetical protein